MFHNNLLIDNVGNYIVETMDLVYFEIKCYEVAKNENGFKQEFVYDFDSLVEFLYSKNYTIELREMK